MKILRTILLSLLAIAGASAAPILTLDPANGIVEGAPGGEVGWGFSLTSDDDEWITVISSFLLFETDSLLGTYQDFIGTQGGPIDALLEPGAADWQQSYNPIGGTGLGTYFLSPLATIGSFNQATLTVLYERYSGNPLTCGDCFLGEGELSAQVEIRAADVPPQVIPEPSTLLLMACGLAALPLLRRFAAR